MLELDKKKMHNSCVQLSIIADQFDRQFEKHVAAAKAATVRKRYTRGGLILPRGYFCPSPILDLVVGGGNRGRLVKNPDKYDPKEITTFWFDQDDQLTLVERPWKERELVVREGDIEIGILRDIDGYLIMVSRCIYHSGKIISYERGMCNISKKISALDKEEYSYAESGLSTSTWFRYDDDVNIIGRTIYQFDHSPDGMLSKYRVIDRKTDFINNNAWEGHDFIITKRRKV